MISEIVDQMEKIEILSKASFIKDTMRTLSNYGERLQNELGINSHGNVANLSFFCTKGKYKLPNKNLNFISPP